MSSLREHIERCEHAVDGPDWAGLRELYPDTLCSHPSSRVKFDGGNRAVVCENCNMIVTHLGGGAVPSAEAERDALVVENAQLRGDLSENRRALGDAINVANGNKIARDALQARLDAMTVEWGIQEREFLDGPWDRIDDGSQWSNRYGKRYTRDEAEAEVAKRVNGIDPKLWRRLVSRLVGPWTVVPEGDTNARTVE